ncbi:hypothetical protein ACFL5Z_16200 [Planctomycetota bacterium]
MEEEQFTFKKVVFWAVVVLACIYRKGIFRAVKRAWKNALGPAWVWLFESQGEMTSFSRTCEAVIAFHMIALIILLIYWGLDKD